MATSVTKDETICKRVLNRSVRRLIEDLDVITVLDYSIEKEFLSAVECRDIKDEKVTSDKIRKVIEKVKEKGVKGYEQFKHLLELARQEHLVKYLTNQESVIQKELQDETAKQERIKKQIAALGRRAATNEDLNYISQCIGSNWEILGPPLLKNKSTVTIEHIKEDHRSCQQRVYKLLLMWRQQTDDQSLAHLFHLMYKAGTSVTIDWNEIAHKLKIERRDIHACKEYQHQVQETKQQQDSGQEYQRQVHAQETKQQEDSDSKKSPKDSCIFDGRLILLDSNQINALEASLDKKPIGQGGIGIVYRCNSPDIFGIPVAVKKINTKGDLKIENQVRREKIACRLMNPFILPLLAVVEKSNDECWFISPYCENGDLHAAIKSGKDKKNNTSDININNQATRVKILLQIALAIQYIHTEVTNVRGPILHKDIASQNVVLDKYLNARLIDFGLAREKQDASTTSGGRKYYEHPDVGDGKGAKECYDYYSFGVIIREMLTSLGPEGEDNHFLKKMDKDRIGKNLDTDVWKFKEIVEKLNELSFKCLEEKTWTIKNFKTDVVDPLREIMKSDLDREIFENDEEESTCHQCIINPIAKYSSLTKDNDNCSKKIRVCMACEKNCFLNPVTCYCGAKLTSMIGSKWGALLVAGDDESQERADAMKNEILELERIVTSLAPRIIGISKHKVKTVVPDDSKMEPDTEESPTWTEIKKHIESFSKDEDIDTLLIYFSCHGGRSVGGNMFELGKKSEYVSLDDFQKELQKLHKIDRLILFLDRCYPPKVTLTNEKFVQINACSKDLKAVLNEEGSLFTKYVIQALKARSEERECSKDCKHCYSYWNSRTEYVSIYSLYNYVDKHLELKAHRPDWKLESFRDNIAFFTDEVVKIEFKKDGCKPIHLSLGYLKSMDEVKQKIFLAFKVDRNTHEVKIRKDTFRNDQQADDECTTLEQVMDAWVQRFPLSVTFHKKEGT
ncbi:uncharacterized protein LOC132749356 isoform X2 [Ruditapes philippinarum]|uniref:uncharacterized protein LOC132749356 isoform X2 n=1 Tax=Ruditapes philippinarum TaxID=129788 RepID=UPI00295B8DBE|nr:uncharacterized protein LOC132749356 isoform X2 [Ruditapes philippinarum]